MIFDIILLICRFASARRFPATRVAAGSGNVSFGPHRSRELLQLNEDCFSSPVDPLHALNVFGIAGRQVGSVQPTEKVGDAAVKLGRVSSPFFSPWCVSVVVLPHVWCLFASVGPAADTKHAGIPWSVHAPDQGA